jgi:hypothetical protein
MISAFLRRRLRGSEVNARRHWNAVREKLGIICAFIAAIPNLVSCESSRSPDGQFQKQVKRAQECRRLQDKLVGDQPLTPERHRRLDSGRERRLGSRWPAVRSNGGVEPSLS